MPKRARIDDKRSRQKDKLRKRQKRQQKACSSAVTPPDETTESVVPCGSMDGANSAPPGNLPGYGSMGLPPKEEKPLARMQASPCVKMHPSAPRLPSPRGSRLFVKNVTKAPSPDSPAWVCAPPRAPGPDTVHVSGPAGQAQLETSMYGGTSRKTKDEGYLRVNKKETERKSNRNENGNNEKHTFSDRYNDGKTEKTSADLWRQKSSKEGNFEISVQGSFHQADPFFEDKIQAGTQSYRLFDFLRFMQTQKGKLSDIKQLLDYINFRKNRNGATHTVCIDLLQASRIRDILMKENGVFDLINQTYESL